MRVWAAVILICMISPCGAAAQKDLAGINVWYQHASGNVYMFSGPGGNMAVSAGPDGFLFVDSQLEGVSSILRERVAELGYGGPTYIINTHHHLDHMGGNIAFENEATIIAQRNLVPRSQARGTGGLPDSTFDKTMSLHFNDEEIRLTHYPNGHTDNDVVVYFVQSNVIHMGDLFFEGHYPFVDLEAGGSVQGLIAAVGSILETLPPDAMVIPGHGYLVHRDALESYYEMLVETTRIVTEGMSAGKSYPELRAAGLPQRFRNFDWKSVPYEQWIMTIYESYSK